MARGPDAHRARQARESYTLDDAAQDFGFYMGARRYDHVPKRSCLGCGHSSPAGYVTCQPGGVFIAERIYTWRDVLARVLAHEAGQLQMFE